MTTPLTPLQQAQNRLAHYLAAEEKALLSQEYSVGNGGQVRRNRRADLSEIRAEIARLNDEIARLTNRSRRIVYVRPS